MIEAQSSVLTAMQIKLEVTKKNRSYDTVAGDFLSKLHAKVDAFGMPLGFAITEEEVSDII